MIAKPKKFLCLAIVLLVVCIPLVAWFVCTGEVYADSPPGFGKGNPSEQAEEAIDVHKPITPGGQYKRLVLIHYAKPPKPDKPDKPGKPEPEEPEEPDNDAYVLLGLQWADLPVSYVIDPDYAPDGSVGEIEAAYEAWDYATTSTELFDDNVIVDPSVAPSVNSPDGVNTVSWRRVVPPNVIAVTLIWYNPDTDEMIDCDVVMNTKHDWGIDPDGEEEEFGLKRAFDVRNIVTHEAGHVVGLGDLYDDIYRELTMYGYSSEGETKKISLQNGDILGCQYLYEN